MARAPDKRADQARKMFTSGQKLIEIAEELGIPEGTVRSWKNRYKWDATLQKSKRNVAKTVGGQPGNKNAVGHGAPAQNKNAEKYGFFTRYLPSETMEIFDAIEKSNPLDLLWHQIQIAYAAIIRAQKIMYVKNIKDKTIEKVEVKTGNVIGEKWEVQQAWDKQASFLSAQARAQGELRSLIKQYDAMLHSNFDIATEEQRARIDQLRAQTDKLTGNNQEVEDMDEIEADIYDSEK